MLISLTNPRTLPSIFHCWRQWRHSTAPPAARGLVPRCASIGQPNRGSSQEYFADGMTEERIGRLSNIRGLRVISHTSAMQYKHTLLSAPEIARTLRVDVLVEGSDTKGKSDSCPGPVDSRRDRRGASPNGLRSALGRKSERVWHLRARLTPKLTRIT